MNDASPATRTSSAWFHCLAWLCLVYGSNGFVYGLANNVEELPAIYHVAGLADYPHDPMVAALVSRWNQATPYIYLLGGLVRLTGADGAPVLFFLLHASLLTLTYMALRTMLRGLCRCSEMTVMISMLALIGVDRWSLLPGQRMLFFHFMDPEHVSIVFCLAALASVAANRWKSTAVHVSLATIIHPLYGLPLIGCLWLVALARWVSRDPARRVKWQQVVMCGAAGLPYSLWIWACDGSSGPPAWDVSRVQELIRSPGCHVIPRWYDVAFWQAWALPTLLAAVAWLVSVTGRRSTNASPASEMLPAGGADDVGRCCRDLTIVVTTLLAYILAASLIASAARIPLLVKLTPYRMAVISVPLLWILAVSIIATRWNGPRWIRRPAVRFVLGSCLAIVSMTCMARARTISYALSPRAGQWLTNEGSEVLRFVRAQTDPADLFLNYSDLDLRTACLRSDAFRFKTIPLYSKAQLVWYRRLLAVNAVPQDVPEFDYEQVRDYIRAERIIPLSKVLECVDLPVEYVVVKRHRPFVDRFASCNGQGNLTRFDAAGLTAVLENDAYAIYRVSHRAFANLAGVVVDE